MKIIHIEMEEEMGTTKVRGKTSKRPASTHQASEAHRKNKRMSKTTERTLLQDMVAQLEADKGSMASIMASVLAKAKEGDKDMLAFIGRYLLGNGKVSLDELTNPPLIKKSR